MRKAVPPALVAMFLTAAGCSKSEEPAPNPEASASAASEASPAAAESPAAAAPEASTCGARLEAKAATGKGEAGLAGMACPNRHGAWVDQDMLREIRRRLDTVAGTHISDEIRK